MSKTNCTCFIDPKSTAKIPFYECKEEVKHYANCNKCASYFVYNYKVCNIVNCDGEDKYQVPMNSNANAITTLLQLGVLSYLSSK